MSVGSPSVTALLPTYNAAEFIDETLESLAAQTYTNLQVLVSVDASDDDTAERCEHFARGDQRFVVVRQARRLGWIRNARELLRRAESELCFFMGHDDLVEPEYVEALVAALAGKPRAVMAYSDALVTWPGGRRELRHYPEIDGVAGRLERGRIVLARNGTWWTTYRGLFRADAARRGQPLRLNLAGEFAADWPFLLQFALAGECVRVPRPLYRKRYRTTSLSIKWRFGMLQWIAVDLCCGRMVLQADFPIRARATLLATLARRMVRDVERSTQSLAGSVLRWWSQTPPR